MRDFKRAYVQEILDWVTESGYELEYSMVSDNAGFGIKDLSMYVYITYYGFDEKPIGIEIAHNAFWENTMQYKTQTGAIRMLKRRIQKEEVKLRLQKVADGEEVEKIEVKLSGEDGNIFNLMSIVSRELKRSGQRKQARKFFDEFLTDDEARKSYDNALQYIMKYVDVV